MNAVTHKEDFLGMPEGLDAAGVKAHGVIVEFLKAKKLTGTLGGIKLFYSPAEWQERGETYGQGSKLIVVYEGAAAKQCFSMDACYQRAKPGTANCYAVYEELQTELERHGLHFEECTIWFAAVYEG